MIRRYMAFPERIYTDEQREALAFAYEDRRIRPARLVVDLAGRGELEHNGARLEPFKTNPNTVRDCARDLRQRRAGEVSSQLEHLAPRDAIEALRRRLVNAADAMLAVEEKRKPEAMDAERLRQITRLVREAAALPGPKDPRPPAPGQKTDGKQHGGQTRGGAAGGILAAHRATNDGSSTAHETPEHDAPSEATHRDNGNAQSNTTPARSTGQHERVNGHEDDLPGSLARDLAAALSDGGEEAC